MSPAIKLLLLSLTLSGLASCSSDISESPAVNSEFQPVKFYISFGHMNQQGEETRSLAPGYKYADGSSISVLKCYIYNRALGKGSEPIKIVEIDVKSIDGKKGGEVNMLLPKGQSFDVVFLGTSIPQSDCSSKLYYSTADRILNVDYSLAEGNDEELDCFLAIEEDVNTETVFEESVILTRPMAQVNIGTQDYADYIASTPVENISVSIDGVYSSMDVMTRDVIGDPVIAVFNRVPVPGSSQVFPVDGFSYLSMNYVLVNLRKLVDISMSVYHNDDTPTQTINIRDVAVERNYQSNIYGKKLLTEYNSLNP